MSRSILIAAALLLLTSGVGAAQELDVGRAQDEAVPRVQEYLRVNTVNPPGNEIRGVEFFARMLDAEDIPYETAESEPGRGNIWARLEGGPENRSGTLLLTV